MSLKLESPRDLFELPTNSLTVRFDLNLDQILVYSKRHFTRIVKRIGLTHSEIEKGQKELALAYTEAQSQVDKDIENASL